jgi:saccharopine dehydrogenase (NAD+, L-lysine-forming)
MSFKQFNYSSASNLFKPVIFLRNEINVDEYRCPLVPTDVKTLIENGFIVYVERSENRVYSNEEYEKAGSKLTDLSWFHDIFRHSLIIGLKCFSDLEFDYLNGHTHVFFAHSFQNQRGSQRILDAFHRSKSVLYDYEYMLDPTRVIAFGKYAGIVGGCLGLLHRFDKISGLETWPSKDCLFDHVKNSRMTYLTDKALNQRIIDKPAVTKICVIGPNGRCGKGVCEVLDHFDIEYVKKDSKSDKSDLKTFDIVFNCILLAEDFNEIWIDSIDDINHPFLLVDLSCDVMSSNHPFPFYNEITSWENPVLKISENIDVIAIYNLPSLLPKESSDDFSKILLDLILQESLSKKIWKGAADVFYKTIYQNLLKLPKVYCVNFQDENRRSRMVERFDRLKMTVNFIKPVFKSDKRLCIEGIQEDHKRTYSIMLQHIDSVQDFLNTTDESEKYCIVCEDDVLLSKRLLHMLPRICDTFSELELDVLLLGYLSPDKVLDSERFPVIKFDEEFTYTGYHSDLWGSQMYMVSREYAKQLIEIFQPSYILRTDGLPYNPDWTITKCGKRALISPMLALEEGEVKNDCYEQSSFHQRCFETNFVDGEFF